MKKLLDIGDTTRLIEEEKNYEKWFTFENEYCKGLSNSKLLIVKIRKKQYWTLVHNTIMKWLSLIKNNCSKKENS